MKKPNFPLRRYDIYALIKKQDILHLICRKKVNEIKANKYILCDTNLHYNKKLTSFLFQMKILLNLLGTHLFKIQRICFNTKVKQGNNNLYLQRLIEDLELKNLQTTY